MFTNLFGNLKPVALSQMKNSTQPKPVFILIKDARNNIEPKITVKLKKMQMLSELGNRNSEIQVYFICWDFMWQMNEKTISYIKMYQGKKNSTKCKGYIEIVFFLSQAGLKLYQHRFSYVLEINSSPKSCKNMIKKIHYF